ncbi:MAG TPA: hypothetical protein VM513_24975 [Kofleriaceae bacterium]|jgi:hypothetical protein|nr:hypothetical protein [Kofleriaceae bacterium]
MRLLACLVIIAAGCGPEDRPTGPTDGPPGPPDACVGLQCQKVDCAAQGMQPTQIAGRVFAPNGTLALYGVNVYVPNEDPGPLPTNLTCDTCSENLPGKPVVKTTSDVAGGFVLDDAPAGENIPLVIQVGRWRKQITIPNVPACTTTTLGTEVTSLPKTAAEGDMPRIAITTGGFDALECLVRKLGVDDSEFTTDAGTGKVHLFHGNGAAEFAAGFVNTGTFSEAMTLWDDYLKMETYNIVMFSCEGEQRPADKQLASMNKVKKYADLGGRLFLSHWHNVWIQGASFSGGSQAPQVWPLIATWNNTGPAFTGDDIIDEVNNPKGVAFADWLLNVMGSATRGVVPITDGRQTVATVDETKADRWAFRNVQGLEYPQTFQFTTPNELPEAQRCGKVVFTDMHVSGRGGDIANTTPFPDGCSTEPLTPQEKALAFMFFDISACVDVDIF